VKTWACWRLNSKGEDVGHHAYEAATAMDAAEMYVRDFAKEASLIVVVRINNKADYLLEMAEGVKLFRPVRHPSVEEVVFP
jgi:hypothetical protein